MKRLLYEQVKASRYFNEGWYKKTYGQMHPEMADALTHYIQIGAKLGYDPSPEFSTSFYLNKNPDVAAAQINPLVHFLLYGQKEGRPPLPQTDCPIFIVYHIAILGCWKEIVDEQLQLLEQSGLAASAEAIYIQMVGVENLTHFNELCEQIGRYNFFSKVQWSWFSDLLHFEFPSIKKVQEIAKRHPEGKIFYFHTKGASYPLKYKMPHTLNNLTQWRKIMEYFNITRWRDCVAALQTVDACGVEWGQTNKERGYIFAGNFWWANGTYVNRCILKTDNRYDCEDFIGTGNPQVKNFFSSGDNPRLKSVLTEEQIKKLTPQVFFNLKMIAYHVFYYNPQLYKHPEDM